MYLELYVKDNKPSISVLKFVREKLPNINSAGHKINVEYFKNIGPSDAARLKRNGISNLPSLVVGGRVISGSTSIVTQLSTIIKGVNSGVMGGPRQARRPQPPAMDDVNSYIRDEVMRGIGRNDKGHFAREEQDNEDDDFDEGESSKRDIERRLHEYKNRAPPHHGSGGNNSSQQTRPQPQQQQQQSRTPPQYQDYQLDDNVATAGQDDFTSLAASMGGGGGEHDMDDTIMSMWLSNQVVSEKF
jgi:hypothetical protein